MTSGQTSTVVESSPLIAHDAASQASLTVEPGKPEDLAANPIEWMASVPPPPAEEIPEAAADWSAEATEASDSDQAGVLETSNLKAGPTPVAPSSISARTPEPPPSPTPAQTTAKPIAQSAEDTAHSILKQDWADLASDLQAKPTEPVAEKAKASPIPVEQHPLAAVTNAEPAPSNSAPPVSKPLKQSAEDTARSIPKQDWADLTASLQPKPVEPLQRNPSPRRHLSHRLPPCPLQTPNRHLLLLHSLPRQPRQMPNPRRQTPRRLVRRTRPWSRPSSSAYWRRCARK